MSKWVKICVERAEVVLVELDDNQDEHDAIDIAAEEHLGESDGVVFLSGVVNDDNLEEEMDNADEIIFLL